MNTAVQVDDQVIAAPYLAQDLTVELPMVGAVIEGLVLGGSGPRDPLGNPQQVDARRVQSGGDGLAEGQLFPMDP